MIRHKLKDNKKVIEMFQETLTPSVMEQLSGQSKRVAIENLKDMEEALRCKKSLMAHSKKKPLFFVQETFWIENMHDHFDNYIENDKMFKRIVAKSFGKSHRKTVPVVLVQVAADCPHFDKRQYISLSL